MTPSGERGEGEQFEMNESQLPKEVHDGDGNIWFSGFNHQNLDQ